MMQRKSRCGFTLISKNVGIKQSIIPEFISGSSTQAVTQEQQPALKTLNKFQGLSYFITPRGFTLIEVLVVVLIIGVLAAIALPMYNKAVLRSRFNALMPIVKAMNDSNEAYFLEHGSYASNPQDLPVQGLSSYPTGTELEFGSNMDYAYVLASNASAKNNYIMYQKHSTNYPGEIHCEAITGDDLAEYICVSSGGTTNLGTTLTEGYTTYVLSGSGAGIAPEASAGLDEAENETNPYDCTKAEELGFTCTADEENGTKKICMMAGTQNVCRTKTYNEDGSYTSITCTANAENVCTGGLKSATYDANGNQLTSRYCSSVDSSGTCTAYGYGHNYTYDANGNQLTKRYCNSVDSSGNCTAYQVSDSYDYTYDANGNMLTQRQCSSVDSSGNCTAYHQSYGNYDYTYDGNGNKLTERKCSSVNSNGNCTAYDSYNSYEYTYDVNGNQLTRRGCRTIASDGSCSSYSGAGYEYTYDANGNMLTSRQCSYAANGSCSGYSTSGSYDYTYDANGNLLTQRECKTFDNSGNCTSYDSGSFTHDYTYDTNGNLTSHRQCSTVASDGSCSAYSNSNAYDYIYHYDSNGGYTKRYVACSAVAADGSCSSYTQPSSYNEENGYDANGNRTSLLRCISIASDGSCSKYGDTSYYYVYDEDGKQMTTQTCSGSNLNTSTGECTAYNIGVSGY